MGGAIYIGDEVHAAAWRLTGIDVRVIDQGADIAGLLGDAGDSAALVLLSEPCAARLPAARLEQARRAQAPLLLVLPAPSTLVAGSELAARVRKLLGMDP